MGKSIKEVEQFWNAHLCGRHFIRAAYPEKAFFEEYNAFRYKKTHHLNAIIPWEEASGKDVLEIGLGIGADAVRWARHAGSYTGIDITEESVIATRKNLEYAKLRGEIILCNTEDMPFDINSFDLVYSHGVLHHTPDIRQALSEIHRVLRPGGKMILMLYCKNSFNYWIRIQCWFRIRLLTALLQHMTGGSPPPPWADHISLLRKKGWNYFSWNEWPHHCTDGPACEIAHIYSPKTAKKLVTEQGFAITDYRKAHFPVGLPQNMEQFIAGFIGFHQFIFAIRM